MNEMNWSNLKCESYQWPSLAQVPGRQFCLIQVPSQQAIPAVEPAVLLHTGRETKLKPHSTTQYRLQSCPTRESG